MLGKAVPALASDANSVQAMGSAGRQRVERECRHRGDGGRFMGAV